MRPKLQIDWKKFDGYTFQDMCNHLLVSEKITIVPFKSGPYADKGQDARLFEGTLEDISGRIVFQSKYHEPKPGRANLNTLKSDIKGTAKKKGEIEKAKESDADHLIIMTNVTLVNPDQHDELLKLAEGEPFNLHIWDEEKIIALLVKNPYVRFFHIKGPDYPMFVPHEHFFKYLLKAESRAIFTHDTNLTGRDNELQECLEYLNTDEKILTIYAAPGQGKSRLVLEFARIAEIETEWQPMFIRHEGKALKDHLEELNPHEKYILFVEDAHQLSNRLKEFQGLIRGGEDIPTIKIVLTARTSLIGLIEESLINLQPFEIKTIQLPELRQDEIFDILKDQLPNRNEVFLRDLIVFVKDSPLLAVSAARLINAGEPLDNILKPGQLRNVLFEIPLKDLTNYCDKEGEDIELYKNLLTFVAAIQPVYFNEPLIDKICDYLSIDKIKIKNTLDNLLKFGFLKRVGRKIRLVPETLANIILEKNCLNSEGESNGLGEKLVELFFDNFSEQLLNNLCDVGQITFKEKSPDILKNVFDDLKNSVKDADNYQRSEIIKKLKNIGYRRAEDILDIVEVIIDNPIPDDIYTHPKILGDISNLMGIVARNYDFIDDAFLILKQIMLYEKADTIYDNYKPENVIEKIIGYDIGKPVEFQDKALEVVMEWKNDSNDAYSLAINSIAPIFKSSVGFTRTYGPSMKIGSFALAHNQAVLKLREKAIAFLIEALSSDITDVQLSAVETVSKIGETDLGPGPGRISDKLVETIAEERLKAIDEFENLIVSNDLGFLLTSQIEKILWKCWWTQDDNIAQKSTDIIVKIKTSPEYSLFKLLYISNCPIKPDFNEVLKKKTNNERKELYFNLTREARLDNYEFYENLINDLDKFDDPEYWINLLSLLNDKAGSYGTTWHYGHFLFALAKQKPSLGYSLYQEKQNKPWKNLSYNLIAGVRLSNPNLWESHLNTLMDGEDFDEDAICDCIYAIAGEILNTKEATFHEKYAENPSEKTRMAIAFNLSRIGKTDWFMAEKLAGKIIKQPGTEKMLDEICGALLHNRPEEYKDVISETEKQIFSVLSKQEKIKQYWCQKFIAKFARNEPAILLNLVKEKGDEYKFHYYSKDIFEKVIPEWKKRPDYLNILSEITSWIDLNSDLARLSEQLFEILYDEDTLEFIKDSMNPDSQDSILKTAKIISNFSKYDTFFDFFVIIFEAAENHGDDLLKKIQGIFNSSLFWIVEFQRTIGKPSDTDLNAQSHCERILESEKLTRKVRKVFENTLKQAKKRIENDLAEDKEMFDL